MNDSQVAMSNPQFANAQRAFPVISVPTKTLEDFAFQTSEQTQIAASATTASNPVRNAFYMNPAN